MFRVLAALFTLGIILPTASSASSEAPSPPNASRAEASFASLQRMFGASDGSGLYREWYPTKKGQRYSYEWPYSQVHVAVLDLTGLPGHVGASYDHPLAKADAAQLHYWSATAPGGHPGFLSSPVRPYGKKGGTLFYDDNEWVGLEDMQDYSQHHDKKALRQAQQIFDLAVSGWDHDAAHPRPGGVFWMQARRNTDRNTVSNMPAAELGLRLYQVTKQKSDLSWATRMYRWTNRNLQRADGLFNDHVDLKGHVDRSLWSYNQGVPIAVNLLLYRETHHRSYLRDATRIASAAYHYFVAGRRLDAQPVYFNSIMLKQMLVLESITGGTRYRTAMQAYANTMWSKWRDPKTGVFHFNSTSHTDVIEQAAATQIYATLAWPRSELAKLA